ncbi:AmmeMemoRadiSam system radical SAM enzyme [Sporomusa acidovorans]|uniref:Radical SAM core domain-containing protein n=1 Tax=Sporomusa acidovorans (strain ATCC 49682 / DSM 3132 / Mol) TaxID=1123286 RepID=A0ABZ3IXA5_SPOA4|nr:AmmeMemoRadiSam system radical SAM enzyme [Sporomusa acidovorans]OZC13953.1 cyclic pyranopterin monophosphate synthase [Sporomusa acidovorans DSM 3132]SDF39929.1 pyruvate formate lyase activating enzyme [Sporomusa acidovorans]
MQEALHYKQQNNAVVCGLCPKNCLIAEGQTGFCRVRRNLDGKLYSLNYAQATAQALDPIEKKPLYHFYPGSAILSLGTWGCNFACKFCQNWQIAQAQPAMTRLEPQAAAALAGRFVERGNIGIAYTYSEPSVWYEYILETARLVQAAGLRNVLVSNGFINERPLQELLPYIAAMNIDVKAFTDDFYRQVCAGKLDHVKRTVEQAAKQCHVEITTLLIPGLNDSAEEIAALAKWLAGINEDMPLHLSRYFPNHKMDAPPTPVSTLAQAHKTARKYLNYVYLGNVGGEGSHTYCPQCGYKVIDRLGGYSRLSESEKKCPQCGQRIPICGEVRFHTEADTPS